MLWFVEDGLMTHGLVHVMYYICATYLCYHASRTDVPVIVVGETADLRERVDVAVRVCWSRKK